MNVRPNHSTKYRWLLLGGLVATTGWAFYTESVVPLQKRERTNRLRITELDGKLESARRTIREIEAMERHSESARAELDRWSDERPADSVMVWFPERVKQHFERFGIADSVTLLNTIKEESELPGFQRAYWRVAVPFREADHGIAGVMLAVAEIEAQDPAVKILDFSMLSDPEKPGRRIIGINLATLVRK